QSERIATSAYRLYRYRNLVCHRTSVVDAAAVRMLRV
ncbi:MAG: hypothetical protein V7642_1231, partial [Burkholderiales bacterium]